MASGTYTPVVEPPRFAGPDRASRSGIWVAIFAITMSFAAFTSAMYVRQGAGDGVHIVLPSVIYANTVALLLSSLTLEQSRRCIARGLMPEAVKLRQGIGWLVVTLILGLAFVAGQYLVWQGLAAQGLYLATNPSSSFFYVFTAVHALHVLGGITAIVYVLGRLAGMLRPFCQSLFDAMGIYWHFMGVLWLYLLFIIGTRL